MWKTAASLFAGVIVVLALAPSLGAATPKRWYWTESRAEGFVLLKVKLPGCRYAPSPTECTADGKPLPGHPNVVGFQLGDAQCTGSNELGQTFKYARFSCRVISAYAPFFRATVAVYVTGPVTFRWKIIG